jgi:hypothetical protein
MSAKEMAIGSSSLEWRSEVSLAAVSIREGKGIESETEAVNNGP